MEAIKGRRSIALTLCAMLVIALACAFATPAQAHAAKAQKVTVYVDSATQKTAKLKASGLKAAKAKWKSSKPKVAVVKKGKVTAKKAGKANITAKQGKKTFKFKVTVKKVAISKKKASLQVGDTATLSLSGEKIKSVKSSDAKVATVTKKGKVTAKKAGKATITLTGKNKKRYKCKVTVKASTSADAAPAAVAVSDVKFAQTSLELKKGETAANPATVEPADATDASVIYKSSDESVATVDASGLVTAVGGGNATITASSSDGSKSAECKINVTVPVTSVKLAEAALTFRTGDKASSNPATVEPADASNKGVTYKSSNEAVATVDASGTVTPVGVGLAAITATTADGAKTATTAVVVGPGELTVATADELRAALDKLNSDDLKSALEKANLSQAYERILLATQDANVDLSGLDKYADSIAKTVLEINAPNASLDNYANWQQVIVNAIAQNTYTEHADNFICMRPANGHVVVAPEASPKIKVEKDVKSLLIENKGKVKAVEVATQGKVTIDNNGAIEGVQVEEAATVIFAGDKDKDPIPTTVNAAATIQTSVVLDITAQVKATLVLQEGSQGTEVTVATVAVIPVTFGVGTVVTKVVDAEGKVVDRSTLVAEYSSDVAGNLATITSVKGAVMGGSERTLLKDATVQLFPWSSAAAEGDVNGLSPLQKVLTDRNGSYELKDVKAGNYVIYVTSEGYAPVAQSFILENSEGAREGVNVLMASAGESGVGSVSGQVIDATNDGDSGIAGITVRIRSGAGNMTGSIVASTMSNDEGYYNLESIAAGVYTLEAVDIRTNLPEGAKTYLSTTATVYIMGDQQVTQKLSMTPGVERGALQFVLRWNSEAQGAPSDLDSHLYGPGVNYKALFHTYYEDRSYCEYSDDDEQDPEVIAFLDRDDIDWEGPETTTVHQLGDGSYTFFVHDYSNRGSATSSELGKSGAFIDVYEGTTLKQTYRVPSGAGTVWAVCSYDPATKKITPINEMAFEEEPYAVGDWFLYPNLKVTAIQKNDLVIDYKMTNGLIALTVSEPLSEDNISKIVPSVSDGATWKVVASQESDSGYAIELSDANGLTRWCRISTDIDWGDLRITGFELNDVVIAYDYWDGGAELYVSGETDFDSYKGKVKPIIADPAATYAMGKDDEDGPYVSISKGNLTRRYWLSASRDTTNGLAISGFEANSVVTDWRIDNQDASVTLTVLDDDPAVVANAMKPILAKEGANYSVEDSDGDLTLVLTDGENTRRYDVYVNKDWQGLEVVDIATNDVVTEVLDIWGSGINLKMTDTSDKAIKDKIVPELGRTDATYELVYDEDNDEWRLEIKADGQVRSYYLDIDKDWQGLEVVELEENDVVKHASIRDYSSDIDLYVSSEPTFEAYRDKVVPVIGVEGASYEVYLDDDPYLAIEKDGKRRVYFLNAYPESDYDD